MIAHSSALLGQSAHSGGGSMLERPRLALILLVLMLVGCDGVTKRAAEAHLANGTVVELVDSAVELRYAENRDVAFNLLRNIPEAARAPLLLVVGPLSVLAILAWMLRHHFSSGLEAASAAAVLAGAIGNVSDRLIHGYVVDFFHVAHWPVFNVADVCVTLGVAGLLIARTRSRAPPGVAA
jgi:signal peptidase II